MNKFDIIIIGGGHAGVEASWIASQFKKLRVALVTKENVTIGSAPCNPAIGGVGKGQIVREIDALGGLMGRLADLSAIQYRTLNESKGPAIQSTRIQIDKIKYSQYAESLLVSNKNISIFKDSVIQVVKNGNEFNILCKNHLALTAKCLVVTMGTFLNGRIHKGNMVKPGGRLGCDASGGIESIFSNIEKLPVKFKTGTPPRIEKNSINFNNLIKQKSDFNSRNFHYKHGPYTRFLAQEDCYLTRTNKKTFDIIYKNKEKSPIFNGQIKGIGPRYCPSIEDKTFRYPDRDSHHVFIEPESTELTTMYPNGISTSLPETVQENFIRTIPGLEKAKIAKFGHAVEYDVLDTSFLDQSLEHQRVNNLYFAGQVNGTSGYEEAAAQGIVAGINAAFKILNKKKMIFSRDDSYIGVLIEDLVSVKRDEPYRLFTARAENRLYIREDNAIYRMLKYRNLMELTSDLDNYLKYYKKKYKLLFKLINTSKICIDDLNKYNLIKSETVKPYFAEPIMLEKLLKISTLDPYKFLKLWLENSFINMNDNVVRAVAITSKYEGYIRRATNENKKMGKHINKKIDWRYMSENQNISNECRERIKKYKPETFFQLKRIEGIRPATLSLIVNELI